MVEALLAKHLAMLDFISHSSAGLTIAKMYLNCKLPPELFLGLKLYSHGWMGWWILQQ